MLASRSTEESQLYMDLEPCHACGEQGFAWTDHRLEETAGQLVSAYSGRCRSCGASREFEFALSRTAPAPQGFGGPEPSRIIDPGQFFALARAAAAAVPADPTRCAPEDREESIEAIDLAAEAMGEVIKFVPDGTEAIPPEAFFTERGRAVYAAGPGCFRLDYLRATAEAYQRIRRAYGGA